MKVELQSLPLGNKDVALVLKIGELEMIEG